MSQTTPLKKPDTQRRWLGLIFGITLFGLLISIWSPGEPRWISVPRLILACGMLALGIYEFVRHKKPKDDA